ncbi:MAG: hypothetical protein DKINENOH_01405 [bacterium]|nr:hypothetical protein [bacterium]
MNCNFERAAITAIIGILIYWRYTLAVKTGWQTEGLPLSRGRDSGPAVAGGGARPEKFCLRNREALPVYKASDRL